MAAMRHDPVMLAETLAALSIRPGMAVVDGTLGLAGHAQEMLKAALPGGVLVGFDWDLAMMSEAAGQLPKDNVILVHADYRQMADALAGIARGETEGEGWVKVAGGELKSPEVGAILLDLGLNSAQIDDPSRGISFQEDGPLDMRMDRSRGEPASSFLNRATEDQLEKVLREFGEENWSRRIAKVIVDRRKQKPLRTTGDLVECVMAAVPPAMRDKRLHPATRSFQGIRIYINGELEDLEGCLRDAAMCLTAGGTLAVLSYHSLEDRATKRAFRALAETGAFEELYKKPLEPSQEEIARNRRSRSAKLRAVRRLSGGTPS